MIVIRFINVDKMLTSLLLPGSSEPASVNTVQLFIFTQQLLLLSLSPGLSGLRSAGHCEGWELRLDWSVDRERSGLH